MIFYFSGTGNTLWAAEILCKSTGDRLVNMADAVEGDKTYTLEDGERIGFCFPVHGWRPPVLVREFIKGLDITNHAGHYCYAVCTAGDNIGETIDILRGDLRAKGIGIDCALSLIMPESYVGLPFMDVDTPDKERMKKEQAANVLKEFTPYIINKESRKGRLDIGRWPRINSRLIGGFFTRFLITDKHFHVDTQRCVKCGLCSGVCPVGNINGGKGQQPEWLHNGACLTCFSCYHHCPTHAIEFGGMTKHKGQYYFDKNKQTMKQKRT